MQKTRQIDGFSFFIVFTKKSPYFSSIRFHQSKICCFLQKNQLIDIVICVQGTYFKAHRVILCAASTYFKDQLLNVKYPHGMPGLESSSIVIITDKCSPKHFEYIMDYIYKGECNVPEQVSIDSIKLEKLI